MANQIAEVMNSEVLCFERTTGARAALELMLALGVTTAPVIDERGHPIGLVSMRELAIAKPQSALADLLRSPALVTRPETSLAEAARLLDEADLHHLAVVDKAGGLVGFVSSLDLLRGLIGVPARHPETFVHWDAAAGTAFSNERLLDPEHIDGVPHAPGLMVVSRGGVARPERVAWVEVVDDLKTWLLNYFSHPDELSRTAGRLIKGGALRYRYAELADALECEQIAFRMRTHAQHMLNQQNG
jgi:predicted transcriptional regulator